MRLLDSHRARCCVITLPVLLFATWAIGQSPSPMSEMRPYSLDSGLCDNHTDHFVVVFDDMVEVSDAAWLRLYFADVHLMGQSFLRLTSATDGAVQHLDGERLKQWRFSSACFNGLAVLVELVAAPHGRDNRVEIKEVLVGMGSGAAPGSRNQCGLTDDRMPSDDPAVGRLMGNGASEVWGTATIYSPNGCMISAGHCWTADSVQFNVPSSLPDGTPQSPPPSDQYAIDPDSVAYQFVEPGHYWEDWMVFRCFDNSETGLNVYQAQGDFYELAGSLPDTFPVTVKITGYGHDDGPDNKTQQIGYGDLVAISGSPPYLEHQVDTEEGNSGSAIVLAATNEIIGVHTYGECNIFLPWTTNKGTPISDPQFQAALPCPPLNDDCAAAISVGDGTFTGTNIGATTDGSSSCGGGGDVWWRYTSPITGTISVDTCGSDFDTVVSVFDDCGGTELACNDDGCGLQSSLEFSATEGATYLVRVGGVIGQTGAVHLNISSIGCAAPQTTRVSVSSSGDQADGFSNGGSGFARWMSADGRYVVFYSLATNLVPGDTNAEYDVFMHDRETGQTTRVSVDSGGIQGNSASYGPALSADGRYVAFGSLASNLVPDDTNAEGDVFVHDLQTGQTTRVSVDSAGQQGNDISRWPSISADGRYAAFESWASNLVPGDTNGAHDVFVHDRETGETVRVSVDSAGQQGNGGSTRGSISGDGRYVAFWGGATNLVPNDTNSADDVFVHDRDPDGNGVFDEGNGITSLVSVSSSGTQGNSTSQLAAISGDGRFVTFSSSSNNLVLDDTNGTSDVFARDLQTGQTILVSVDSTGTLGNGWTNYSSISEDGRYVGFRSYASNLVPGDTNGVPDVFVHDQETGETTRVSVDSGGNQGNDDSGLCSLSSDGRCVAFTSDASNLVPGDANGTGDIFVRDQGLALPSIVTHPASQEVCQGQSVAFSVQATGDGPLSYQWRRNGTDIPAATSAWYELEEVQPDDAGEYDVVVSNACGSVTSNAATLTVNMPPTMTLPESQTVCVGEPVTFSVTTSGAILHRWQKNEEDIPGATEPSYTIPSVVPDDAGEYRCVATNSCGTTTTSPATLTVRTAPTVTAHPEDDIAFVGEAVQFGIGASGSGPRYYQWKKDGQEIPGATDAVYLIDPVDSDDAGQYACVLSNDCGSDESDAATLWVFPPCCPCVGDLTDPCDSFVNVTDFTVFASAYGSQVGNPDYDACADLAPAGNPDGTVNITDFTIFASYYLMPCP